ncbi:hypothetical protein ACP275_11G118400 [Erythranthe tilingii]
MAAHHHPCHHPPAAAANTTYCHCHCYSPTYTPYLHPQPPDPHPHHHHHPPHQPHPYPAPIPHLPNPLQYNERHQDHYFQEEIRTYPAVSSLLRRIAALESALGRRSSSTSAHSLRDAAARTIQTHFRSFLLRRSVTLRHLKDLASIKSTLGILKSSISEKPLFNYDVVYHKAMDLLLKLDTIKGGDPMIRNGKASVSRDLNRFFDFIDGVYVQRRGLSLSKGVNVKSIVSDSVRKTDNVKHGGQKRVQMEKLKALVSRIDKLAEELDEEEEEQREVIEKPSNEFTTRNRAGLLKQRGGVHTKVQKNVSFAENGKIYRVLRKAREPILEDYCDESNDRDSSVDAEDEDFGREVEEIGVSSKDDDEEEDGEEDEDEDQLENDGEKESRIYSTSGGNFERKRYDYEEEGIEDFVFSAPLPAKMEKRGVTQTTRERN